MHVLLKCSIAEPSACACHWRALYMLIMVCVWQGDTPIESTVATKNNTAAFPHHTQTGFYSMGTFRRPFLCTFSESIAHAMLWEVSVNASQWVRWEMLALRPLDGWKWINKSPQPPAHSQTLPDAQNSRIIGWTDLRFIDGSIQLCFLTLCWSEGVCSL